MVSIDTALAASDECEKLLRMGDRVGRASYDKKKLLLYAMISGSRRLIERLLRDLSTLFNTIEDFLWFKLSVVRDFPTGASSALLNETSVPYSLDDLQAYLNKFEPSYYTKGGKDPLVYPYVLLLSIQFQSAILYLSKESRDEGYSIDATHIAISLADHAVLGEGTEKLGIMDAYAEASSLIRQYGAAYLRLGNLPMALEYYAQAAAAVGGGQSSWTGRGSIDQQRQKALMLKQLLTEILLRDGGTYFLLGSRGSGEEGELARFFTDTRTRQQFLLEAANQCLEAGLYEKVNFLAYLFSFCYLILFFRRLRIHLGDINPIISIYIIYHFYFVLIILCLKIQAIEIQKRVGAFSMALDTINRCLSSSICALSRGRLDGESQTAGLINSGNDIMETYKYYPDVR